MNLNQLSTWLVLLGAFLISFIFTYLVKKIALKKAILDIPNKRSSHSVPTPRGGGAAFVIVWYFAVIILYGFQIVSLDFLLINLPGLLIVALGLADDLVNLSPGIRLLVQIISSAIALYMLGGMQAFDLGFYKFENPYLLNAFALVYIIWMINLFNFSDGIDGYAAAEAIVVISAFTFLSGDNSLLILVFALAGFLMLNWQTAKIFMGDIGSTMLGYTIAVLSIFYQNEDTLPFTVSLTISMLFWFDASYTLIKRKLKGQNISEPHRKHIYQRLVRSGFSHAKTVLLLAFFVNTILLSLSILTNIFFPNYILLAFSGGLITMTVLSYLTEKRFSFKQS